MSFDISLEKCRACRACELACSFHLNKTFNPEISKIKIVRANGDILLTLDSSCYMCPDPLCVKYCRFGAIKVHQDGC